MKGSRVEMEHSVDDDFERFYRRELAGLVRLAHLLTGSNIAADDIVHEAFLRVRDRWSSLENPGGYLRVVTVNMSRNWNRSDGRRIARERRAAKTDVVEPADVGSHDELLALVDDLPFRQRAVLVARYWLDLPESEIADFVGCRPGTVKSLSSRALTNLRKELT